jgi:hypothetical protein
MQHTASASRIGPYSRPATLSRIDGRSREARFRRDLRAQLVQHVGGAPSATQAALIELAVDTSLQIELMKRRRDEAGALTPHDHHVFLAWLNTLSRTMRQLGLKGAAEHSPSLADYLKSKTAA